MKATGYFTFLIAGVAISSILGSHHWHQEFMQISTVHWKMRDAQYAVFCGPFDPILTQWQHDMRATPSSCGCQVFLDATPPHVDLECVAGDHRQDRHEVYTVFTGPSQINKVAAGPAFQDAEGHVWFFTEPNVTESGIIIASVFSCTDTRCVVGETGIGGIKWFKK